MRRARLGMFALVLAAVAAMFDVPAATQGQGGGRIAIEMIGDRAVSAREILVRFREQPAPAELANLRSLADGESIDRIGRAGVMRVRSRSLDARSLLDLFSRRADVLYAEPNYIVRALSSDPSFPQLWGLQNVGQTVNGFPGTPGADINAVPAWDISVGSTAHVVAVIDTGVDYDHPDLAPNMWSAPSAFTVDLGGGRTVHCAAGTHGFNAITGTCSPMDDQNHGTHVAGTIGAAGNNGIGVVGVNWTAQMMALKFLDDQGSGTIAGAIDTIRFAIEARRRFQGAANVRILAASWGEYEFSQALKDEIEAAGAEDMLFVAAAGNSGFDNDILPLYPASYDLPNVISVGASTNADDLAWFSNYGAATVHLGAPGMDILSTLRGNTYGFLSGTSMAAPHVSGAAALVLSRCELDTAGLKAALLGSVESVASLVGTTITGGRLDVNSAMHSCIAPPPAPASLSALGMDGEVLLTWSSSLGATGYTVKRSLVQGGPYTTIATDVQGARYTDESVVNNTTYYYVVSASNPLGSSGDSNEASATPNPPSDLVIATFTAPSSAGAGMPLTLSVTTTNQGVGPAPASATRIYLSTTASLRTTSIPLDPALDVPVLTPGASHSATFQVVVPADATPDSWYLIAVADAGEAAFENLETNNTRVRSITIGPDLSLTGFTAPSTAASGEVVTVSDTTRNQGGGTASASVTGYYFSTDSSLDASDTSLATRSVPSLGPGSTNAGSATVTIPPVTQAGTYYLIAKADAAGAVAESLETNNTSARSIRIGADLVISSFSTPLKGGAGLAIQVTDTTKNLGTANTGTTFFTRFYLSTDSQIDAADPELGGRTVPALAAGAEHGETTTLMVPPGTTAGSYFLLAKADAADAVVETFETNNTFSRTFQVGGDLTVTALTVPASAGPGSTITVSDTTTNQGGGAIGATVTHYYFSSNSALDAQDRLLGERTVTSLGPGLGHSGSATVTIPSDATGAGSFYIIAKADGADSAVETLENNNLMSRTIQIGGDLVVSALSAPSKGGAGATLLVSDTTLNQGTGSVSASVTRFYLSVNTIWDAGDPPLQGTRSIPELAAGASSAGSTTVTVPPGVTAGSYYLIAKADADNAAGESQEGNNTAYRSLQIGPDLTVSSLTVPAKIAAGVAFSVTETTTNQGGASAPASTTTFFLSANAAFDAGDQPLNGQRAVNTLAPGALSTGTTSLTIPAGTAAGSYYIIARSDGAEAIAEVQETNNTRLQSTRIGPDLTVSAASLSASTIVAGSSATLTDTVLNQGAGAAGSSITKYYLSSNLALDGTDTPLAATRAIPVLAANASSSGTTSITIPAGTPPGSYYVLANADADNAVEESLENNNSRLVRLIQVQAP